MTPSVINLRKLKKTNQKLQITIENADTEHRMVTDTFIIESSTIINRVVSVDTEDNVVLKMNLTDGYGFQLNLKCEILKKSMHLCEDAHVWAVLVKDI